MTQEYIIAPILALTQLSIALNIVCIVAYNRANFFTEIIEETVLCTKTKIADEIKAANKMSILILGYLEKLGDTKDRIVIETKTNCQEVNDIFSVEKSQTLIKKIDLKCKPHCLPGLFAYCTLYGIIFMIFLLYLEYPLVQSAVRYFGPLSIVPIITFVVFKTYIDHFLYKQIENSSGNDNLQLKIKRKKWIKRLYVINAFWAILVILGISLLFPLVENMKVIFDMFSDRFYLLLATSIPYFSFLIYIVVYSCYSRRRRDMITQSFGDGKRKMEAVKAKYKTIVEYNKKESDDNILSHIEFK